MIRALFNLGSEAAPRVARRPPTEPRQVSRRDFLTFGRGRNRADGMRRVAIDADRCTDCRACVRVCGAVALRRTDDGARVVYALSFASCNGCGDCAAVCARNAVTVSHASERRGDVAEIAGLTKRTCGQCGRLETGVVDEVCAICQSVGGLRTLRSEVSHD